MDSLDGGNCLVAGVKPGDIAVHNSLNSRVKTKGSAEGCWVFNLCWCLLHEMFSSHLQSLDHF